MSFSKKNTFVIACFALFLALGSHQAQALQFWKKSDNSNSNSDPKAAEQAKSEDQKRNDGSILVFSNDFLDPFDPFHHWGWDLAPSFGGWSPFQRRSRRHPYQQALMNRHLHSPFLSDWFFDDYHEITDKLMDSFTSLSDYTPKTSSLMKPYSSLFTTDLVESDQDYKLTMDLPGIDTRDISISIEENKKKGQTILTIAAERKQETETQELLEGGAPKEAIEGSTTTTAATAEVNKEGTTATTDTQEKTSEGKEKPATNNNKWIKQERLYGKMERQMIIPENVNVEAIKSQYANGVLTISLPKVPVTPQTPTKRQISIESL